MAEIHGMTEEAHKAYQAAIKPLTDLYGTEYDLWQYADGKRTRTPNPVWNAASAEVDINLAIFHCLYPEA